MNKRSARRKIERTLSVAKIIEMIPKELIEEIGKDTGVDHQVKHLHGALMFKLFLISILKSERISTRLMEFYYNSFEFSAFSGKGGHTTRHSSIADRIKTMDSKYLEQIFKKVGEILNHHFKKKQKVVTEILRFDSTMVSVGAGLIDWGMRVGKQPKTGSGTRQLKFTIGLKGILPTDAKLFTDQKYLSEDLALREVIVNSSHSKDSIVVFDRGLQKRKTFAEFEQTDINFVTRMNEYVRYEEKEVFKQIKGRKAENLIPDLGSFISPDPYVQAPDMPVNFNRYAYALNNPLVYTDPTGEKWNWKHWLGLELLTGGLVSATATMSNVSNYALLMTTASTIQATTSAIDYTAIWFKGFSDPGAAGERFENALKIDFGILKSFEAAFDFDQSAQGIEWPMQIYNNFHGGESIQTIFGNGFAHYLNISGEIDEIGYYKGRTIIRVNDGAFDGYLGVSHGHYIFGEDIALNLDDDEHRVWLFAHEFGHTYQSRITGPAYYLKYGFSSAGGANFSENDADYRAYENFGIWPHGDTREPSRMEWWEYFIGPFMMY